MKLPKCNEKFIVNKKSEFYSCYGLIVSGVHIEIRADEEEPGSLWYIVAVDKVYDDLFHSNCIYFAMSLDSALDFIAQHLTPYQEPDPETQPLILGGSSGKGGDDVR